MFFCQDVIRIGKFLKFLLNPVLVFRIIFYICPRFSHKNATFVKLCRYNSKLYICKYTDKILHLYFYIMEIGKRIKEVAEAKKVSAIELAKALGKSRQAIYDIYKGKVSVNIDLLEKIAFALDKPMIHFFKDPEKPLIDRQALKEIIVEIIHEVMIRYYVHYSDLQELSKEIHEKAMQGEGLVHLRVNREEEGVELITEYRKLKKEMTEQELSGYAQKLYDDFFSNKGPLWDRLEIKKLINKFFDEKGDGYAIKLLN